MNTHIRRQRGEGKVGCVVTLFVLAIAIAAAAKAVPVYWNNSQLKDAAKDLASRASVMSVPLLETQLKNKAKELEIPEALAPGAISIRKSGDTNQGNCSVTLKYSQKIDFYGIAEYVVVTDVTVTSPYIFAS
jgi:hypothetical protein